MRAQAMQSKRGAFTLIELLVVVAIIALLAALLLPSLKTARAKARMVGCVNNLHQMSLAYFSYASDFGDFPQYTFAGYDYTWWWSSTGISSWQVLLPNLETNSYLKARVGYCPEINFLLPGYTWRPNHDVGNRGDYLYTGPGVHSRYWYGAEISPRLTETEFLGMWGWGGVHVNGTVRNADGTVNTSWSGRSVPLLGDSKWVNWSTGPAYLQCAPHFPRPGDAWSYNVNKGFFNVLFTDGAVRPYPYSY